MVFSDGSPSTRMNTMMRFKGTIHTAMNLATVLVMLRQHKDAWFLRRCSTLMDTHSLH
jgi:hypothetical protein